MSLKAKVIVAAVGPSATAYVLFTIGLGLVGGWVFVLINLGLVLAYGVFFAVIVIRARNRRDEELRSADKKDTNDFDFWRWWTRRRKWLALFWAYLAGMMIWIGGVSVGTVFCVGAALVAIVDLLVFQPRLRAWTERLGAELEAQEPASTA